MTEFILLNRSIINNVNDLYSIKLQRRLDVFKADLNIMLEPNTYKQLCEPKVLFGQDVNSNIIIDSQTLNFTYRIEDFDLTIIDEIYNNPYKNAFNQFKKNNVKNGFLEQLKREYCIFIKANNLKYYSPDVVLGTNILAANIDIIEEDYNIQHNVYHKKYAPIQLINRRQSKKISSIFEQAKEYLDDKIIKDFNLI